MSYTCPQCGKTSHHIMDERERYCGHCHLYASDIELYEAAKESNRRLAAAKEQLMIEQMRAPE